MRAYSNVPIVGPVLVAYLYTMAYSAYSDTLDSRNSTHDRVYPSVVSMHGPLFSVHFKAELRLLYTVCHSAVLRIERTFVMDGILINDHAAHL